jgi:hypothetical protein
MATGNSGPDDDRWGDYFTARRHVPYGDTWVGTAYVNVGGPNDGDAEPHYVWFGRQSDEPPDHATIYVDADQSSWYQTGSSSHPFSTVEAANFAAVDGDDLVIRGGDYPESLTMETQVDVTAEDGNVDIGSE